MDTALITFSVFMLLFLGIGVSAIRVRKASVDDYLIGGREMGPWLSALSAASTNCSGFMFIGLIGLSYTLGVYAFWFLIGIVAGTFWVWRVFVPKMRELSGAQEATTYLQFILPPRPVSSHAPTDRRAHIGIDRWFAGLITLFFLALYAAAQLKAGTKALHTLFDWPPYAGIWMSAGLILLYCLTGGYRASVWSDAAQSVVMFVAMSLLAYTSLDQLGGWSGMIERLSAQDPQLSQLFPTDAPLYKGWLSGFSWACLGIGCLGQPHIMIRPIALKTVSDVAPTRRIFFSYYILFVAISVLVGVCARALIPLGVHPFDPELALPHLASAQLTPALIGVVLAGVFASTISTADSQVLSCSAVLGQDLSEFGQQSYRRQRWATMTVILVVATLATFAPSSVFTLVILAWSALAAPFVPLVVLQCLRRPLTPTHRLGVMLSALFVFGLCRVFGAPWMLSELFYAWAGAGLYYMITLKLDQRESA